MSLDAALKVAETVLYEGYILYPYRASHGKNQARVRWQFGVLVPRSAAGDGTGPGEATVSGATESWYSQTETIADAPEGSEVEVHLRFLQLQARRVEALDPDGAYRPVEELKVGDGLAVTWDEGVERQLVARFPLRALSEAEQTVPLDLAGAEEIEDLPNGRIVRRREPLSLLLRASCDDLPGPYGITRLRLVVENVTDWVEEGAGRETVLARSALATHLVAQLSAGSFVSLVDPPEWAKPAAGSCVNVRLWPCVMGGRDIVLSSPMVLPDEPELAPESPMDLFDGLENDELLALRIQTLSDEEKVQVRATDPKAAAILDLADNMPPEIYERLHGAIRSFDVRPRAGAPAEPAASIEAVPELWTDTEGRLQEKVPRPDGPAPIFDPAVDASFDPDTDTVEIAGTTVGKGSRVRLAPPPGGSDAQDLFLVGREATVNGVFFDAEDEPYLAVTLDDDPGADLWVWHGRFLYFKPSEVVPL